MNYKHLLCAVGAAIGGFVSYFLGGFTMDLLTLVIFMAVDFATGLIVAAFFGMSNKTKSGTLSSQEAFRGLAKKITMLILVGVANMLDKYMGVNFVRGAVIVGFLINELISIVENAGLMGITSPAIEKALDILKEKINEKGEEDA